jgi:glutathione S-transferase
MSLSPPLLWHLKVSNYNEKVRWALDFKDIPHRRKAVEPGRHSRVAKRLAGIDTFPVLELNGKTIGDSMAIIAALEDLKPDPPLYPQDQDERERALELEEYFDEEVGPKARSGESSDPTSGSATRALLARLRGSRRSVSGFGERSVPPGIWSETGSPSPISPSPR